MLKTIKDYFRRRQMLARGIKPEVMLPLFTAGARSGVWSVLPTVLGPTSIVYSAGVGDNLAWDVTLIDRFDLTVHAFDPTPASVAWVQRQSLPAGLVFHPLGLSEHDGDESFVLPTKGSRYNFRPCQPAPEGREVVTCPVRRLTTLMQELGHQHLDVLKLDIEGSEYAVLDDLLRHPVAIGQLLLEFHHHFAGIGIERTVDVISRLRARGYLIADLSARGLEMTLIHDSLVRPSAAA